MKKIFLIFLILIITVASISYFGKAKEDSNKIQVTVYKSPTCGCCVGYISELRKQGFSVKTENTQDMSFIKGKYNIPRDTGSCHTSIIEDYFIEGHVPIEVVNKLLEEKPNIDGISLPNMPAGSPGMPGIKSGDFIIYSITNGEISKYMRI